MLPGHHDRQFFGLQLGLTFAPDTGRINETKVMSVASDELVYGVSGRARSRRDDRTFATREPVQQSGFAHIGVADDCNLDLWALYLLCALGVGIFGESPNDLVQQVIGSSSMFGGNRRHVPDAKAMKVGGECFLFRRIDFVDSKKDRLASPDQQTRKFQVGGCKF